MRVRTTGRPTTVVIETTDPPLRRWRYSSDGGDTQPQAMELPPSVKVHYDRHTPHSLDRALRRWPYR